MHSPPSILGLGCWQNSRSAASGAQKPASSSPPGSGLPQVGHILYSGTVLYQHEEISEIMKYCTEENKIFTEKLSDFKKKITKQKDHIDEVNKLKISLSEEMNTFKDYKQTLNLINKTMGYMINWMQVPMELEGGQNVKDQDSATSTLILQYHLRGLASNNCSLEEYIKKLQEDCEALQSENRALEEESKMLTMNIPKLKRTYNERKKKLESKECKVQEYETQLSASVEKVNMAMRQPTPFPGPLFMGHPVRGIQSLMLGTVPPPPP
ncbi:uncharacterized protein LOC143646791 isoform X2 [Tamandua tetradactyla]|uniref:uncharacterized protein LOC143646791 isoform X2 n=1 Tax=Tamandua tetradactyla TaxID=48850 RepID=UPI0040537CCB